MAITYREAGVDIDAGEDLVERIKPLAKRTRIPEVVADIGGFAGLCQIPTDIEEPLLVSGTDGVGTKLLVAIATGRHDTIGQDLVAMCANDIATCGARPLFFLDYFACGKLDVGIAERVIAGIADGCSLAGCALIGGETAEMPGMYKSGEYDLAGFCVGVVGRRQLLGPDKVRVGDRLLGITSSGLHSNGYSLARRVFETQMGLGFDAHVPELGTTVGEALLVPTRIYPRLVSQLKTAIGDGLHALCHVTGGGVTDNLPRVLPPGTRAQVRMPELPVLFRVIQAGGPVELPELLRTFNCGLGLIAAVDASRADAAVTALSAAGEQVVDLGEIVADTSGNEPCVEYV